MKVGFIGLGHMGAGMAASLLSAGHQVTVYNRVRGQRRMNSSKKARLRRRPYPTPAAAMPVMTMLADDAAIESAVYGSKGLIVLKNSLKPVCVLIHFSWRQEMRSMMGERTVMQEALFYGFSLERHVPSDHMLRSRSTGSSICRAFGLTLSRTTARWVGPRSIRS